MIFGILVAIVLIYPWLIHVQLVVIRWCKGWDEILGLLASFECIWLLWRIELLLLSIHSCIMLILILSRLFDKLLLILSVTLIICVCLELGGFKCWEHLLVTACKGLVIKAWTFVFLIL